MAAMRARARVRLVGSGVKPTQVSARAHNRVLDAAQKRVDKLEPRLAGIIEEILDRAGTRAANLFHARATRHGGVPDETLIAAAANSDVARTSTMIALKPRRNEAAALADPEGDPPEILHVTLAYLGDTDQPLGEIADAMKPVVATHGPLSGVVGGLGMFHPAGVGIALPDVRGLTEVRQAVVEALHENGIDYGRDHGFTAHITINGDGEAPDPEIAGQPLHFDSLHVVRGDDEEIELPLVGVRALTAAGPDWSPPFADELLNVDALIEQILAKTEPVRRALIEQTMTAALKQAGLSFDVNNPLTAKLFADTASQVTNIAMTTRANLMDIIGKSYQNGLTIPATRDLIREGMRSASKTRATMIARTEMARAVNGGSLVATQLVEQETGQAYNKVWHTAPGAKYPRHELYPGLDGQTVAMDQAFEVGEDQLQYPGDPDGEPGETINCRCALSYVEVRATGVSEPGAAPEPALDDTLTGPLYPLTNTNEVDTLVADLRHRARLVEPGVTPIMRRSVEAAGGKMVGLTYKLKKAKSAIEKIVIDAADRGISPFEDAKQINDMLRYTAVFSPEDYVAGTTRVLDELTSQGLQVARFRNTWDLNGQYAGVNTLIQAPNGFKFELQFQTPESFNIKQKQHDLYVAYKKLDPSSDAAKALDNEMIANTRSLTFPPDIEKFDYVAGAPPAPPPEATAPPPEATGAPRSADIGITPFRAGEDNAVGFYDSTKYRQFITDIQSSAKAYGVKIDGIDKVTGVWEGDLEPSVSLRIHADNEIAHSKPPPIDFADATPEQRDRIQQAVDEAYARMDQAGVMQDWSLSTSEVGGPAGNPPHGIYRPPSKIVVVHEGPSYTAEYDPTTNAIKLNVDGKLFPVEEFNKEAATIAKGELPGFLNRDLADAFVHEYGHAAQDSLTFDQRIQWRTAWEKLKAEDEKALTEGAKIGTLPSKYAGTAPQEAWGETFVGLVDGYPQGAPFQDVMRPLLQDSGVLPEAEDTEAYRGQHTAPGPDFGSPMYDLTQSTYPEDVYDTKDQVRIYGQGGGKPYETMDQATFNTINAVRGDPTAMVTVYRAVPANVDTINPGDWVTPSKGYAEMRAESNLGEDAGGHIVSMQVPAAQLWTDGNSIQEWGWNPPGRTAFDAESRFKAYVSNLGQAYNQDGVIMFKRNAAGDSVMATFSDPLPEQKVIDAMEHVGLPGGRFTTDGRLQIIGEATQDFANQIKQLSEELGGIKLDIGEPMPLYTAMNSYTGPGSSYFKDVNGFTVGEKLQPEQIRAIFQEDESAVAEALGVRREEITGHVQMEIQKAFKDATKASIDNRALTQEITVYGPKPEPGAVQAFFLKPQKGLQAYTVNRDNILVDMDAFTPEGATPTNEVLISGEKVTPGAVEQDTTNTGAYTLARGDFSALDRDEGDYRKALDAFSHPQGVTAFTTPTAEAAPVAAVPHGEPITDVPIGEPMPRSLSSDRIAEQPAQAEWLHEIAEEDAAGVPDPQIPPIALIHQYTEYGSYDVNAYLSGKEPDFQQWDNLDMVKQAAKQMEGIVGSAPPLPDGTALYRGVDPTGIDPSLAQQFSDIEQEIAAKLAPTDSVSELTDRLGDSTVTYVNDLETTTMTVANKEGEAVGNIAFTHPDEMNGKALITKITLDPKYAKQDDYYAKAMLARLYQDQGFKSLVWDNFETLDQAKFGVEMAVRNPSWNLIRVATNVGSPVYWTPGEELSVDSLAFANLGESAKMELGAFIDQTLASTPNTTREILNDQTKALGDWAAKRYPVGSYAAMGEPGEFASLTTRADFAASFRSSDKEPALVFRVVNAKTGAPIWNYSSLPSEHEVLAPPGTMYRVRSVTINPMQMHNADLGQTKDNVVVTLEEAPKCGPGGTAIAASLVAAVGVACTNIAQYVPSGKPPEVTVGSGALFPGQDEKIGVQAAAHRAAAIARYAADNHMSVETYKAAADQIIKTYIEQHPQIRVRVTHQTLDSILETGRFKSEFEIPGITGDETEDRAVAEKNLFGYPADLAPAERPIYGYLAGTADETGQVQEYGDIIVNLDPAVNARATFTIGDSYSSGINGNLSPSLLGSPGIGSWDGSFDIVKAWNEGDLGQISRYIEVEIHGGLPASDIGGITPDAAMIVSRQDAARVHDAVEAVTELAANYEGTQTEAPQVEQAGVPLDKPPQLDYATALRGIAKNASLREGALAELLARVGLKGKLADNFVDFSALNDLGAGHL